MEAIDRDDSLAIGEALGLLRIEFPDVSISKIRFLESKGLIAPERTTSGFRRFLPEDIDRLRAILRMQRDQYLPLKIIREQFGVAPDDPKPGRRGRGSRTNRPDQQHLDLGDTDLEAGLDLLSQRANSAIETIVKATSSESNHAQPLDKTLALEDLNAESEILGSKTNLHDNTAPLESRTLRIVQDIDLTETPDSDRSQEETVKIDKTLVEVGQNQKWIDRNRESFALDLAPDAGLQNTREAPVPRNNHLASKVTPKAPTAVVAAPKTPSSVLTRTDSRTTNSNPKMPRQAARRQDNRGQGTSQRDRSVSKSQVEDEIPPGFMTIREFQRETSTTAAFLADLDHFGIVKAKCLGSTLLYSADHVELVKVAKSLASLGLTPRHLKSLRVSIEKEFGLMEQLVVTQLGVGGARAKRRAQEVAALLNSQTAEFRNQMLSNLIRGIFGE